MWLIEFTCTGCDLHGSNAACWGNFSYAHGGDTVPIESELAVCLDCRTIVAKEVLPDPDALPALRHAAACRQAQTAKAISEARSNRGWLRKLFGRPVEQTTEVRRAIDACERSRRELAELESRLRFLNDRTAPPRCLACGGIEVHALNWTGAAGEVNEPPQPVGVRHPGCGGAILASSTCVHVSLRNLNRLYDIEGHLLLGDFGLG